MQSGNQSEQIDNSRKVKLYLRQIHKLMIDHKKLLGILERVCSQPMLYTRKGTYDEIISHLEKASAETCWIDEVYFHSVFTPFLRWFVERRDTLKTSVSLEGFRENFASDDEAIEALPILYQEFVEGFQRTVSNTVYYER